jgi:heptose-I-phosphate ethanolaminephosphotransferase
MQIYGYNKETTPLLNSIKDSLFIFSNVISSDIFTLKAVPKLITSLDNDNKNKEVNNLVEIFNKSGYKTYWLSNQRAISYHDNAISRIASNSYKFKFYNHKIDKHTTVLDEVIFPDYISILNEPGKKVIFIRIIGTHFDYNKRYPSNYNKFVSNSKASKKQKIINYYDNAILYNDFIVYSFIKELQKRSKKSALLYLSDHGENVYDNTDFFGRSEDILRKSMFEIPFFVWVSKDFVLPKDFEYKPNRMFMADHTYESIGHLFGVLCSDMNVNKSIFSKTFKERKRKVLDNIDYDSYFLEKHE